MVLLLFVVPLAAVAFAVSLARRPALTVGINEHDDVVRIARHTRWWRGLGLVAGLVLGLLLILLGQWVDTLGRATALAPAALGAAVLGGTVLGELTARPRVGVRRAAVVETRTVRSVLPGGPLVVLVAGAVALAALLAVGVAWGSTDGGSAGERAFTVECRQLVDGDLAFSTASSTPWPGAFYAVPMLVAFGVVGVLGLASLVAVVRRPRPPLGSLGLDSLLRRWSARMVVTAMSFTVLGTLGPVAAVMALTLADPGCPATPAQQVVRWVATVVAPLALLGAAATLGALLVTPTIRVDDLPRPTPGDAAPVGAPVR